MRILKKMALPAALSLMTGCASIVSGGLQAVPINSTPTGARLEITDGTTGACLLNTQTPSTAMLKRDSGFFKKAHYRIRISKEGCIPQVREISAGVNGWYFGNILFGGIIGLLIVDPATGAMWKLDETPINLSLYPDTSEGKIAMDKAEEERVKAAALAAVEEKAKNASPAGMK
jgi:hypothetical protein